MKISIGNISLANGHDHKEEPYDFSLHHTRQTQMATPLRSNSSKWYDRGNQTITITFSVTKQHTSVEAAQQYVIQHAIELNNLSSQLIIVEEPSQKQFILLDAVMSEITSSSTGITSTHFYKIIGGNLSSDQS